jgi:hypothetical protein
MRKKFHICIQVQGAIEIDTLCGFKGIKCGGAQGIHLDLGPCYIDRKGAKLAGALVLL